MDGTTTALIVIAIILVIAIAVWLFMRKRRTDHLRETYGDEYDRTLDNAGRRDAAEADLLDREKRVKELNIRPLTAEERDAFTSEWTEVKAVFVDSPAEATLHADRLLAKMMQTRGYPMADFDRRYEDLTVNHGDVARHYREGHELATRQNHGDGATEDRRQAMKHYEALFDHMVRDADAPATSTHTTHDDVGATTKPVQGPTEDQIR